MLLPPTPCWKTETGYTQGWARTGPGKLGTQARDVLSEAVDEAAFPADLSSPVSPASSRLSLSLLPAPSVRGGEAGGVTGRHWARPMEKQPDLSSFWKLQLSTTIR